MSKIVSRSTPSDASQGSVATAAIPFAAAREAVARELQAAAARARPPGGGPAEWNPPRPSVYEPRFADVADMTLVLPQGGGVLVRNMGRSKPQAPEPAPLQLRRHAGSGRYVLPAALRGSYTGRELEFVVHPAQPETLMLRVSDPARLKKLGGDPFGHVSLALAAAGENPDQDAVIYAGTVQFGRDGQIARWTNDSGHYMPHPGLALQAGLPMAQFEALHVRMAARQARFYGMTMASRGIDEAHARTAVRHLIFALVRDGGKLTGQLERVAETLTRLPAYRDAVAAAATRATELAAELPHVTLGHDAAVPMIEQVLLRYAVEDLRTFKAMVDPLLRQRAGRGKGRVSPTAVTEVLDWVGPWPSEAALEENRALLEELVHSRSSLRRASSGVRRSGA